MNNILNKFLKIYIYYFSSSAQPSLLFHFSELKYFVVEKLSKYIGYKLFKIYKQIWYVHDNHCHSFPAF